MSRLAPYQEPTTERWADLGPPNGAPEWCRRANLRSGLPGSARKSRRVFASSRSFPIVLPRSPGSLSSSLSTLEGHRRVENQSRIDFEPRTHTHNLG